VLAAQWTEGVAAQARRVFPHRSSAAVFRKADGEVDAVLRRLDAVPWWSYIPGSAICSHGNAGR